MPCSLDEAFAEADTIKIKKKKDRSKKKQFVYPEQINAISSILKETCILLILQR